MEITAMFARFEFNISVILLYVAACNQVGQPVADTSVAQASVQKEPDRWYLPMQLRNDGCYVGPNKTEPGNIPKPCPE
jgi:hypothetical protein